VPEDESNYHLIHMCLDHPIVISNYLYMIYIYTHMQHMGDYTVKPGSRTRPQNILGMIDSDHPATARPERSFYGALAHGKLSRNGGLNHPPLAFHGI
jgi:hypothetical protein